MDPIAISADDYNAFIDMFREESDRGAAVLAGSFVENYLGTYLKNRQVDASLSNKIFSATGALSTFEQRIDFAQAFGFLPKHVCRELHLVRKIRNHFAHYPKSASFKEAPISDWASALSTSQSVKSRLGNNFKLDHGKTAFLISCGVAYVIMQDIGRRATASGA